MRILSEEIHIIPEEKGIFPEFIVIPSEEMSFLSETFRSYANFFGRKRHFSRSYCY